MSYKEEIQEFKKEFALLKNATLEEKKEFDTRFKKYIREKSAEEKKDLSRTFFESAKDEKERAKNLAAYVDMRLKLEKVLNIVSMAYISENYFHKSRSWFNHRLNNSKVNGVPVSFNESEVKILSFALDDIGTKMKDTARLIVS
jgi:hypothetical protein